MRNYDLKDRILGSLITAGVGDALGAPVEGYSRQEIHAEFGRVKCFRDAARNTVSPDNNIAEVTDDTSQLVEMARAVIRSGGNFTVADAAQALVNWSINWPKYYPRNAGTTTLPVIEGLRAGEDPVKVGMLGKMSYRGATNGAVMRVASAGLIHPGDLDGAVETAIAMTAPSHGTQHGFSGAAAVACAIAEGMTQNSNVWSVLRAAVYGAKAGSAYGAKHGRMAQGPEIVDRIETALEIVLRTRTMEEAEIALQEAVGCDNISIQTAVSVALAFFAASKGDSMKTLISCVNIGGDTDTYGCVAGMIVGAFNGCAGIPEARYRQFRAANPHLDFEGLADGLYEIAARNANNRAINQ